MNTVGRLLRAFGLFWWDFLVGDTPELALATAALVGLAFLLAGNRVVAAILSATGGGRIPLRQHLPGAQARARALTGAAADQAPAQAIAASSRGRLEALDLAGHHEAEHADGVAQPRLVGDDGAALPLGELVVEQLADVELGVGKISADGQPS